MRVSRQLWRVSGTLYKSAASFGKSVERYASQQPALASQWKAMQVSRQLRICPQEMWRGVWSRGEVRTRCTGHANKNVANATMGAADVCDTRHVQVITWLQKERGGDGETWPYSMPLSMPQPTMESSWLGSAFRKCSRYTPPLY